MYYHEELAFTIKKGKCAGKATGDAGSIPACESLIQGEAHRPEVRSQKA